MKKLFLFCPVVVGVAYFGFVNFGQAASIAFGPARPIAGASDVSTTGTLDRALSFQISGNVSPTVNGVAFAPTAIGFNQSFVTLGTEPATVTLSVLENVFNSTTNAFAGTQAPFTGLNADFQTLLQAGVFYDNAMEPLTVTLNNLIVGAIYEVQFFVNDSRVLGTDRFVTVSAGSSVDLNFNSTDQNGGLGQFVLGTFTADSEFQDINFLGGSSSPSAQLNAMQLRLLTVPEPGVVGLLFGAGFWGFLLALRRATRGKVVE